MQNDIDPIGWEMQNFDLPRVRSERKPLARSLALLGKPTRVTGMHVAR